MKLNKIFYIAKNLAKSGFRITRDNSIWNKTLECKFESSNNLPNHVGNCIIIKEKDNLVTVDRAAIELAISVPSIGTPLNASISRLPIIVEHLLQPTAKIDAIGFLDDYFSNRTLATEAQMKAYEAWIISHSNKLEIIPQSLQLQ